MTYRLIIFDFDGTLADSAPWFLDELAGLAARHRFRCLPRDEIERLRACSTREILKAFGVARWRLPFIAADMRRRMAVDAEAIRLFDGVGEMLAALKAGGATTAVVSSNSEANVRRILGPELAARIDLYDCGSGLFGKAKRFSRVIRRAGVRPGQTLCVGDERRDIEAAKAVGADSAAVLWGYATPAGLAEAGPTFCMAATPDIAKKALAPREHLANENKACTLAASTVRGQYGFPTGTGNRSIGRLCR